MNAQPKVQELDYAPLPRGFVRKSDGIYRVTEVKDGHHEDVWLCSQLQMVAFTRGRDGTGWGRLVEVEDPDGGLHSWSIPSHMFAGDATEVRAGLLNLGLQMASGPASRSALSDLLQRWEPPARALPADRLGWCDETCDAFILGNGRVIGSNYVVYQQESAPSAAAEMKAAGTLAEWRDGVARRCIGNPLMIVGVSLAFAGPLLEPLGLDGGGLHLRGASSSGKSTVQRVAVSVWGSLRFLHSWRATANGLEGVAAASNGSLLALDEIAEISGREAGAAAYMLANGAGKARADRAGRARSAVRWRVPILSSGEITLADKMAEGGTRAAAGQGVRLLDIAADNRRFGAFDELHDAPNGAVLSDRLKQATATAYGTAGPEFVEKLIADREVAVVQVRSSVAGFREKATKRFGLSSEGQTQRAVDRLALMAASGELATAWGLTGWQRGAAAYAALDVLGLWLEGRGGRGPAEAREAVERTRAFLVANGAARFEPFCQSGEGLTIRDRANWRQDDIFYIAADTFREIHRGADPTRSARHLEAEGLLVAGDGRNLAARVNGVANRPRAYAVKAEIMGTGND